MSEAQKPRHDPSTFYEEKGLKRHMIIVKPETQTKLKEVAKKHKVIQGEIIDVLMERVDVDQFAELFSAIRSAKTRAATVSPKMELKKKITGATPEQLAQIEAILAGDLQQ